MIEQQHVHYCGCGALGIALGYLLRWWHARRAAGAPPLIDRDNTMPKLDAVRDEAAEVIDQVIDDEQRDTNRPKGDGGARRSDMKDRKRGKKKRKK